jgi:proteasome lid subunit RPN8/RPN11
VHLEAAGGLAWSVDVGVPYFGEAASALQTRLVTDGALTTNQRIEFRASALPRKDAPPDPISHFTSVDLEQPLPSTESVVAPPIEHGALHGNAHPDDAEAIIAAPVLSDAAALTKEAGPQETGGILIGRLHRDATRGDVLIDVTAHVPARHTVGDAVKLTFTADTWTDARSTLSLRGEDEMMLGWWHSHPAFHWCSDCPIDRRRACRFAQGFLSTEDKALHRAMFPRAFTLALVMTHTSEAITPTLFGWRRGVLERRAFRLSRGVL